MILLLAVLVGLLAGLLRAWYRKGNLQSPSLRFLWLVPVAFLPQMLAFNLPATRSIIPDGMAAACLVITQSILLVFAWFNLRQPGFWLLGLGLVLNAAVIVLNGGLMPISPETVTRIVPGAPPGAWEVGQRLGASKDIVLPVSQIRLEFLSDRFLLPDWFLYRVAFSIGDVIISLGAFVLMWSLADHHDAKAGENTESSDHDSNVPIKFSDKRRRAQPVVDRRSGQS